MPTAAGIRGALDAQVDRGLMSPPVYLAGYLIGGAVSGIVLLLLGHRWWRD